MEDTGYWMGRGREVAGMQAKAAVAISCQWLGEVNKEVQDASEACHRVRVGAGGPRL